MEQQSRLDRNQTDRTERNTLEFAGPLCPPEVGKLHVKSRTPEMSAGLSEQAHLLRRNLHQAKSGTGEFTRLPAGATGTTVPHWLIQLCNLDPREASTNIEIVSDVILGITRDAQPMPDFDLSRYGGVEKGVSRLHAMLRPSQRALYLIDLGSTNGTCINGLKIGYRIAVPLQDGDLVNLGALDFIVKILATPDDFNRVNDPEL